MHLPSVLTQADTEIECHCKVSYYTHIVCPSTGAKVDSVENGKILERNRREGERERRERERERKNSELLALHMQNGASLICCKERKHKE